MQCGQCSVQCQYGQWPVLPAACAWPACAWLPSSDRHCVAGSVPMAPGGARPRPRPSLASHWLLPAASRRRYWLEERGRGRRQVDPYLERAAAAAAAAHPPVSSYAAVQSLPGHPAILHPIAVCWRPRPRRLRTPDSRPDGAPVTAVTSQATTQATRT